jgi:hypothetical protein
MDFPMMCETITRTIFQCSRFDDPLGRLANTTSWAGLNSDDFSEEYKCKAWAVISRLQNEYLDSTVGRENLYHQSKGIKENILQATTNQEIIDAMYKINVIVNQLNISEFPHIFYRNSNDK